MSDHKRALAMDLFQQAYRLQMQGDLDRAVELYRESLQLYPTAEAHTFLGWTYRFQGKLHEAIDECKRAISVDPSFGNPYNDIGAYLIELKEYGQAIPWLEKAIASERYESYHYPWFNLGRAYVGLEWLSKAKQCFEEALKVDPDYLLAAEALTRVRRQIQ